MALAATWFGRPFGGAQVHERAEATAAGLAAIDAPHAQREDSSTSASNEFHAVLASRAAAPMIGLAKPRGACPSARPARPSRPPTGSVASMAACGEAAPFARSAMSHSVRPTSSLLSAASGPTNSCFSASTDVMASVSGMTITVCGEARRSRSSKSDFLCRPWPCNVLGNALLGRRVQGQR